jgi:hypothetical protein
VGARKRRPVTPAAASDTSHSNGGAMISGRSSRLRSETAASGTIRVSVIPPGTSTFGVTPVPARSAAITAVAASAAALLAP